MTDKKCPNCGLWSTNSAILCDCGYDFNLVSVKEKSPEVKKEKPTGWINAVFGVVGALTGLWVTAISLDSKNPPAQQGFMFMALGCSLVYFVIGPIAGLVGGRMGSYFGNYLLSNPPKGLIFGYGILGAGVAGLATGLLPYTLLWFSR